MKLFTVKMVYGGVHLFEAETMEEVIDSLKEKGYLSADYLIRETKPLSPKYFPTRKEYFNS